LRALDAHPQLESNPQQSRVSFGDAIIDMEPLSTPEAYAASLSGPIFMSWNVTNKCNLRCRHCYNYSGEIEPEKNDLKLTRKIIQEIKEIKPFNVCLCGGEPLLKDELLTITEELADFGILVSMVSNGTLLTKQKARDLKQAGLSYGQVSIDGVCPETHQRLRGTDCWAQAIKATEHLLEEGICTLVAYCPTKFNIDEVPDMIELSVSIGITSLRFMPMLPLGRTLKNAEDILPSDEDYLRLQMMIRKARQKLGNRLFIEWGDPVEHIYLFSSNDANTCTTDIRSDGSLIISPYLPFVFGNLQKHTFREYWDAGFKDAWRLPWVAPVVNNIVTLEDIGKQEPLPWVGDDIYVDLVEWAKEHDTDSKEDNERFLLSGRT